MNSASERSTAARESETAALSKALSVGDLTWLYIAAIVNLNLVPVVAADGIATVWLWTVAIVFFFVPQGIAVMELAEKMPGEGGLYLWAKETFGDFHGFMCGWCYWLTNMFFVPSLLFYVVGAAAYLVGSELAENRLFFGALTIGLLWMTIYTNVRGLGVGKWVTNIGGIGTLIIVGALIALAVAGGVTGNTTPRWHNLGSLPLGAIGVVCLAMVGLEIGPVMGDEVRDPKRTFPRAILLGGALCAFAYMASTFSLAITIPPDRMVLVQGLMQAIDQMSSGLNVAWILGPLAAITVASIAGSTSAWVSGSARMLFVSGLDQYLPTSLGKVHPKHGSPYIALIMFGALTSAVVGMSFLGATVEDAYLTLVDLAVALQMMSYAYVFASLLMRRLRKPHEPSRFGSSTLMAASISGCALAAAGFFMAFVPTRPVSSIWIFEIKMITTLTLLLGIGAGSFFYYSRQGARN